jgi:hypothetical protein
VFLLEVDEKSSRVGGKEGGSVSNWGFRGLEEG